MPGPANLYGVANAPASFLVPTWLGADVACPGNISTAIYTSQALIAPSPGWFYAVIWATVVVSSGASVPNNSSYYASIGAGSQTSQFAVSALAYVANGGCAIPVCLVTPPSQSAWVAPGSTVTLWFAPATNAATVRALSPFTVGLFRAPDQ